MKNKRLSGALLIVAFVVTSVFAPVGNASAATYSFARDLTVGSTGADVVTLQQFLVSKGFLVMPVGVSMGYFGPITKNALARYQASVLIAPAVGYFGPITRANLNVQTIPGTTPTNPSTPDDDDDNDLSGGEGDITDFRVLSSPNNEDVAEGDTVQVFGFEFEADDSDLMVQRLDIHVNQLGDAEIWDVVETARLYHGDDEVAEISNLDDEDEWSEVDDEEYRIRFSNIDDGIVREGDTDRWYVEFDAVNNIDSADFGDEFEIFIPRDGIRAVDAEDIFIYAPNSDSTVRKFTVEEQDEAAVTLTESDDNPESGIIVVDNDDESDEAEVLVFEIESSDSDLELDEIRVYAESSSSTVDSLISELMLEIDGEEFEGEIRNGNTTDAYFVFDIDGDVTIDEDDVAEAVVTAVFNKQSGNYSASSERITFSVPGNATAIRGESTSTGDDITDDDVSGGVDGNEMTLALSGVTVEVTSKNSQVVTPSTGSPYVTNSFRFKVTALEDTVFIPLTIDTTASSTAGFTFDVTSGSGQTTMSIDQLTNRTETNNRVRLSAGQTAEFEALIVFNPDNDQTYSVALDAVRFYESATGNTAIVFEAPNTSEFRSNTVFVPGN